MSKDYAAVIEEGENIPEDVATPPMSARQRGNTITYRGRTTQFQASSQNDHLEVTDEYFEVEVSEFGSDETHLIKVLRSGEDGDA